MRVRIVGISVVATIGLLALAPAASAEAPEFGRCVKVAKGAGSFKNGGCSIALAGGSYEWLPGPGANNKFTIASTTGTFIVLQETVAGNKVICRAESGTGEYSGTTAVRDVVLRFTGCETSGGQVESAGQFDGVVVFNQLEGELGIEKLGETAKMNKIGLDLRPEAPGGSVAEMRCGALGFVVRGSVISQPLAANKMAVSSPLKYREAKGKQKPQTFVGMPPDFLEVSTAGSAFEQSGFGAEGSLTSEEPIEANSVL